LLNLTDSASPYPNLPRKKDAFTYYLCTINIKEVATA
jgi:hypothetical protein